MKPNKAAAAILAINPAILRGLHVKLGFDFEQEITIKRLPTPFTVKAAWKHADAHEPERITPATHTAAIIFYDPDPSGWNHRPRTVAITADNIRDDFNKMSYSHYDRENRYVSVFDNFYTKGDFNDMRKKPEYEAFIIAQRNDLLKPWTEPERDWTQRQPDMTPGEHEQRCRVYYGNRRPTIIIDKSNYRVDLRRDDLKRRAAKLRAERQKAAADAAARATSTSRYNDLLMAFNAAKQRIITALVNVDPLTMSPATVTELEDIGKAVGEYAWKGLSGAARDIINFEANARGNRYTTPERYDEAYNNILQKLAAIMPEDASPVKEAV